jgi:hypothetical protein
MFGTFFIKVTNGQYEFVDNIPIVSGKNCCNQLLWHISGNIVSKYVYL